MILSMALSGAIDASAQPEPIALKSISYAQWQQKLASYPPDIVVVDMWATWCVSCIERFPKMVELYHRFHRQGVRFVSLCLDDREDQPALRRAEGFLRKQQAVFENYLMDENLMKAFEWLDLIGIPAVVIYDRKGKEAYRLTGDNPNKQFTDKDVENAILTLLKQAA